MEYVSTRSPSGAIMLRYIALYLLLAFILPAGALKAQEKPEAVKEKTTGSQDLKQPAAPGASQFVDADGDGIDDRKKSEGTTTTEDARRRGQRQRARDRFVDTDGDGINDNRSCGVCVSGGTNKGRRCGKQ